MSTTARPRKTLRILMLHGYTQSGELFRAKTRALEKNLQKAFPAASYDLALHYPTGPCQIHPADIPNYSSSTDQRPTSDEHAAVSSAEDCYGWFVRKGEADAYVYDKFDQGLERVVETLKKEGPFDGVLGFSQGGFMAGAVASLLEEGRREAFDKSQADGGMPFPESFLAAHDIGESRTLEGLMGELGQQQRKDGVFHPALKFAVSYSGFRTPPNALYDTLYDPKIKTPILSFLGSYDTVVSEERSLLLVDACEPGRDSEVGKRRVIYHPGGHFVPASQRQCLIPLLGFIRESMGWDTEKVGSRAAEDLNLPF